MYDSDRKYLARFALDPEMEYGGEILYESDFSYSYEDEMDQFVDENLLDPQHMDPEDDFSLE
jgi:hypothetical protein